MKHVILPYTPEQALDIIQQLHTLIDVLHHAYQLDFIDSASPPLQDDENQIELFDDPLDF